MWGRKSSVLSSLVVCACAALLAGPASAASVDGVTVSLPIAAPQLGNGVGVYTFTIGNVPAGAASEFSIGTKVGHCIDYRSPTKAGSNEMLRSGDDVNMANDDPGSTGLVGNSVGVQQIKWLLLSSLRRSSTNDLAAAHQLAIWRITNPNSLSAAVVWTDPANGVSPSLDQQLLASAKANAPAAVQSPSLSAGDASSTCVGTTRTVTLRGSPFTTAHVTVQGGATITGKTDLSVDFGADGVALLQVLATTPGSITVNATVPVATLVQVALKRAASVQNRQDMAYVVFRDSTVSTTFAAVDCTPQPPVTPPGVPVVPPNGVKPTTTAEPGTPAIAIAKQADRAVVKAGENVHYTISVSNPSKTDATKVEVCDSLPDHMTYVSADRATFKDGKACWRLAVLSAGSNVVFNVTARVDVGSHGRFTNIATATSPTTAPVSARATVRVPIAKRSRAKHRGKPSAVVG